MHIKYNLSEIDHFRIHLITLFFHFFFLRLTSSTMREYHFSEASDPFNSVYSHTYKNYLANLNEKVQGKDIP